MFRKMFSELIRKKRDEIINSVMDCVRINSVESAPEKDMPFGRGVAEALNFALELSEKMGFRSVNIDNKVGYAEYGQGNEMIAILGHLDIVPAGEGWTHDPFGEISGDRIYGRGTLDDKGPVIGALYALDAVRALSKPFKRRVRIIFGTNEETGSRDMERYNQTEEQPVMAFTPDADYPVIFSEKGIGRIVLKKETAVSNCISMKAGTAVNKVPDHAYAELKRENGDTIRVETEGISAHGSTPEEGVNAIARLMESIEDHVYGDLKDFVKFYNKYIGYETDGKLLGLKCDSGKFGATTINPGLLKGEKGYVQVTLDCRYPFGEDFEKRIEEVKKNAGPYGIDVFLTSDVKPLYVPEDSVLVRTLQTIYSEQTGDDTEPAVIGGGTYAKSMKNTVAFGPVFPGQENVIHKADEYISIDDLMKNTEIMAHAIYRLGVCE